MKLSLLRGQIHSLVRELRSHKVQGQEKKSSLTWRIEEEGGSGEFPTSTGESRRYLESTV